ncbi:hypothetical protein NDU88_001522 [Pleurodeles waltl]|uniref:Uncharacterized protein n=1 Tax=Pleurodeles waltl TaxID=8319 RepID=A0AAV7M8F5_PLEWA|nr:hypothetical protein NDU88_001522 [Pleurodeles waltl]
MAAGVQRTLAHELQKTEKELCEAECGVASGTVKLEDLGIEACRPHKAKRDLQEERLRQQCFGAGVKYVQYTY